MTDTHAAPAGPINVPPAPELSRLLVGLAFVADRRRFLGRLVATKGPCVSARLPVFGDTAIITDPALVKQVFTTSPEVLHNVKPNLSRLFGPGSVFALDGPEHRRRRKLLTPPFHGRSIAAYESIVEEETFREIATWPEGTEFATLAPIWGRLEVYRREYESLIDALIDRARRDPGLDERTDILALFLRSRYDDGSAMTRGEIGDELLTLLAAGHETTASTLAWVFERISRHPDVLASLSAEAAGEESSYRQATILETQRVRTVIDFASRHVAVPVYELGPWRIPRGYTIMVNLHQLHHNPVEFPDPEKFEPRRFVDAKPNTFSWVPFGGGTRRCVGAAFANLEMDLVLRTVLRTMTIQATDEPDEKPHNRGVAFTPKRGGRVTVHRRGGHV
ncbi:MAG: cytochrome P450 [Mycobacteriaceae bacterium]|nr:cytochrome P450 [Mycobacteriaceae bacterium]